MFSSVDCALKHYASLTRAALEMERKQQDQGVRDLGGVKVHKANKRAQTECDGKP